MRRLTTLGVVAGLLALVLLNTPLHGQSVKATVLMVTDRALSPTQSNAAALDDVRGWDRTMTELQRTSRLRRRSLEADRSVRGRTFERFDQMHEGVRVFGADVTRQTNEFGQAVSVFGTIYEAITVDTAPEISATRAALILASVGNGVVGPFRCCASAALANRRSPCRPPTDQRSMFETKFSQPVALPNRASGRAYLQSRLAHILCVPREWASTYAEDKV